MAPELGLGENRLMERGKWKKWGKWGKKKGKEGIHYFKMFLKVAFSLIALPHLLFATPPAFFPSALFRRSPELIYCLHMDTRSCLTVPKHDGSGRPVFCRWPCVAGYKQGSDASHQELFPENIESM